MYFKINIIVKYKNQVFCIFFNSIMFHQETSAETIEIIFFSFPFIFFRSILSWFEYIQLQVIQNFTYCRFDTLIFICFDLTY